VPKKWCKKKVGCLLLIEEDRLVGILSHRDILWALIKKSQKELLSINAIDISPKKIAKINPTNTIEEAIRKMKKLNFRKLPVIYENKLVGLVTVKDILNFNPEFYPELEELSKIREEANKLQRIKKRDKIVEGICEECGNYDILNRFNGLLICETCQNST